MRNCHPDRTFLRDRKLGKTYKIGYGYHQFTEMLLTNLKDRFPSTNFIGIRVLNNRDAKSFMRLYDYRENMIEWQKSGERLRLLLLRILVMMHTLQCLLTVLLKMQSLMLMMMQQKAQIKRAFVKSLKTKKLNKKVLGEFIELVA